MTQTYNNLIKFPLEPEFITYWGNTAIARFIKDNYLELRVRREDYSLITEGAGVKTKQGFSKVYGEKETKRIGFRVRVRSQNEDLYLALLELANFTSGENCSLQPIEILDYCYRHNRKDRDRGYRLRIGVFEGEFSQVSGSVTAGYIDCNNIEHITGSRYGTGFSFKFMETNIIEGYF